MTELRKRMIEDMQLAGLSQRTQEAYVRRVRQLAGHCRRSPDRLTERQLRDYLMHLREVRNVAKGTFQQHFFGIEFLRRFLMHVLPKGFHKLRYYGLWHHSKRPLQERARLLLSLLAPVRLAECLLIADVAVEAEHVQEGQGGPAEASSPSCPHRGSHRVQHLQERCRGPGP